MQTVSTLLVLTIVHVKKDLLEMDAHVQHVSGPAYSLKIVNCFLYSCCPVNKAASVSRFPAQLKIQSCIGYLPKQYQIWSAKVIWVEKIP